MQKIKAYYWVRDETFFFHSIPLKKNEIEVNKMETSTKIRENPRPADYNGVVQTKADDSTFDRPHYLKIADAQAWKQEDTSGNRPTLRIKITFKDGRVAYASLWDKTQGRGEES
jgi:hypothetical protein